MRIQEEMCKAQLKEGSNKPDLDNRQQPQPGQLEILGKHWFSISNPLSHGSTVACRVAFLCQVLQLTLRLVI